MSIWEGRAMNDHTVRVISLEAATKHIEATT